MKRFLLSLSVSLCVILAALAVYRALPARTPDIRERIDHARELYEEGNANKAIEELDAVIAAQPSNGLAWFHRGKAYFFLERYQEAIADFSKSAELGYPEHPARLWLGVTCGRKLGDWARQEKEASVVLAEDPIDGDALGVRAEALLELGRPAPARKDVDAAVAILPDEAFDRQLQARVYYALKDYAGARQAAFKAIELAGQPLPEASEIAAMCDRHEGFYSRARETLDRAIKETPARPILYLLRGQVLLSMGNIGGGVADYERFVNASNPKEKSWAGDAVGAARVMYRHGRFRQALLVLDRVEAVSPGHIPLYELRARVRYELGDTKGALADAKKVKELNPSLYSPALRSLADKAGRRAVKAAVKK